MTILRRGHIIALTKGFEGKGTGVEKPLLYVFVRGKKSDPHLLSEEIRKLKSQFRQEDSGELEVGSYDSESEAAEILDDLLTRTMFAPRRLIIVDGADEFVSKHLESIERFVRSPSSGNCLALIVSNFDGRSRFGKLAHKEGKVIRARRLQAVDVQRAPARLAEKRGKLLEDAAAQALIERTGYNLSLIESEVEKLCLSVGERQRIREEDVEALVGQNPDFSVFCLFDACVEGDCRLAQAILERLFSTRQEYSAIVGALAHQIRQILTARLLIDSGASLSAVMRKLNLWERFRSKYERLLNRFSSEDLARFRKVLLETDIASKTGKMGERLALELLVTRLCSGRLEAAV